MNKIHNVDTSLKNSIDDIKHSRWIKNQQRKERNLENVIHQNNNLSHNIIDAESYGNTEKMAEQFHSTLMQVTPDAESIESDVLVNFASCYITELEVSSLLKTLKGSKLDEKELESFSQELSNSENPAAFLEDYFRNSQLNIGEIYIVLTFLHQSFNKKKHKFSEHLKKLLYMLEQQEPAYLLEFFSLVQHLGLESHAYAQISSKNVSLSTVRQVINFIKQNMNGDYTNNLHNYIKYNSKLIAKYSYLNSNYEDDIMLAESLKLEKNLFVLQSLITQIHQVYNTLKTSPSSDLSSPLIGILDFSELVIVSDYALNTLLQALNYKKTPDNYVTVIKSLLDLFYKMSLAVYDYKEEQQQKVIDGIRNILSKNNNQGVSFLKPTKKVIEFI